MLNEVGCYASHLSLWRRCAAGNEPMLIMEDDFVAHEIFPEAVEAARELIDRFGFIRFESCERARRPTRSRNGAYTVRERGGFSLCYLGDPPLCMTAYAVSPDAARALAAASRMLIGPVDKFMQCTWLHRVPLFALTPASVTVSGRVNGSTIGNRRDKSRNPLLLTARLVYKGIGRIRRERFNAAQLRTLRTP